MEAIRIFSELSSISVLEGEEKSSKEQALFRIKEEFDLVEGTRHNNASWMSSEGLALNHFQTHKPIFSQRPVG